MPRSQNAHAIVNAGFIFDFEINTSIVNEVNIVYGGISSIYSHAEKTKAILIGKDLFTDETLQLALNSLFDELAPEESPPEPSAPFRKLLAISLFYKVPT